MNFSNLKNVASINPGISNEQADELSMQLGREIPDEYRGLLQNANGFVLDNGLVVYSSEDIFERNATFEVQEYAPGYLAIGDDSGGRSILISFEGAGVYIVDQGSMDPDDMVQIGNTLSEWVLGGCVI